MAHVAVGFLALALLALVLAGPDWFALHASSSRSILSLVIVRYRTVADRDTVTARTLSGQRNGPLGRHRRVAVRPTGHGRWPGARTAAS